MIYINTWFSVKAWEISPLRKKRKGLWSESDLQNALDELQNKKISYRAAALKYKIPPQTLHGHVTSGSRVKKLGRARVLSEAQEKDLAEQIKKLSEKGVPITSTLIRKEAYFFCEEHGVKHRFNGNASSAGKKWLRSFMTRNKDILNINNVKRCKQSLKK